ncbi:MAG: Dihydroxy-acid dehydratase [candidate division BRC1 bacterium ADurb.BinA364]|nr:MAG: Dihydroxy-acid dehydratase [candidate division BRC1 bacterium ADurb.BinA364]
MKSDTIKKGMERAPHRSLLRATGVTEEDWDKPFIAIACSHVDIIPGHVHLDAVGEYVKRCVREAGGVPFLFHSIGVDDGIAMGHSGMKYSLPSRELIADGIETMLRAHCFDGMICIPNCDKIVPGMLMAAMRVNLPTIFVSGGPMEAGVASSGKKLDLIDAFYAVGKKKIGQMGDAEFQDIEARACPTCGSCSGMFTANSMNCLCEALGMALPGNGTILATSDERRALYRRAARQILQLVALDLKPRDICTPAAVDNAMALDMAMGGSTNTVLHVMAVAREAEIDYGMSRINDLSAKTPNICKVAPSPAPDGSIFHIQDVHRSGGIHTILGSLQRAKAGLIDGSCKTVTGETLAENIAKFDLRSDRACDEAKRMYDLGSRPTGRSVAEVKRRLLEDIPVETPPPFPYDLDAKACIREVADAYSPDGGLTILYGNLAEEGSVVKTAGVLPQMMVHEGPAIIFESQEEACEGILGGKVKPGDVVVIRYEGPRGGPGMQEMLSPTSYIKGMNLHDKCALITDGRFSGGTSGACVGHISPEAAEGGAIGLLKNGDIVRIDIPRRKLEVKLSDAELAERRRNWRPPEWKMNFGWLARYRKSVANAAMGAVLKS